MEVIRTTQAPLKRPNAAKDMIVRLLEEMLDVRINVKRRWAEQEGQSPNQVARKARFAAAAGLMTGMN